MQIDRKSKETHILKFGVRLPICYTIYQWLLTASKGMKLFSVTNLKKEMNSSLYVNGFNVLLFFFQKVYESPGDRDVCPIFFFIVVRNFRKRNIVEASYFYQQIPHPPMELKSLKDYYFRKLKNVFMAPNLRGGYGLGLERIMC